MKNDQGKDDKSDVKKEEVSINPLDILIPRESKEEAPANTSKAETSVETEQIKEGGQNIGNLQNILAAASAYSEKAAEGEQIKKEEEEPKVGNLQKILAAASNYSEEDVQNKKDREENLQPEKPPVAKYSEDDFQKSRNSKTASLFQKHGKLLDEPVEKKKTDENKKAGWSCFFCCCRKKK